MMPVFMMNYIREEMQIMLTPLGRATLYILLSLVLMSQYNNFFYFWIGCSEMFTGVLLYISAKSAGAKLAEMKGKGIKDGELHRLFAKYDTSGVEELNSDQVKLLCEDLGVPITGIRLGGSITVPLTDYGEIETVMAILDSKNDGKVRLVAMCLWYIS